MIDDTRYYNHYGKDTAYLIGKKRYAWKLPFIISNRAGDPFVSSNVVAHHSEDILAGRKVIVRAIGSIQALEGDLKSANLPYLINYG